MIRALTPVDRFTFGQNELLDRLHLHTVTSETGYWQYQFARLSQQDPNFSWYLGVDSGKIVYSGSRQLQAQVILRIVLRYTPKLQFESLQPKINKFKWWVRENEVSTIDLIAQLKKDFRLDDVQIEKAIKQKILSDLDIFARMGDGSAVFVPDEELGRQAPSARFALDDIVVTAQQRQKQWEEVKQVISNGNLTLTLDKARLSQSTLAPNRREQIEKTIVAGESIERTAERLGRDLLEVTQLVAKLVGAGIVRLDNKKNDRPATIAVIDDSPLVLKQIRGFCNSLGYPVVTCQDPDDAVLMLLKERPSLVFIDINMPGISGFDLVKSIRQNSQLAQIPIVMLTGEEKLSNKWRAQWSGCDFMNKPLSLADVTVFQQQLQVLVEAKIGDRPPH
jgi:CheY-like chemotaxis protein